MTIDPKYLSARDGFFSFPTQTLLHVTPDTSGQGETTAFEPGQNLGAYTCFADTSVMTPAVKRSLEIYGGFGNSLDSKSHPKSFTYEFADNTFPNILLIQPRLNSVEEWKVTNFDNDSHPMHIHVNDFQVQQVVSPLLGTITGVQQWGVDSANVPQPTIDSREHRHCAWRGEPAQVKVRRYDLCNPTARAHDHPPADGHAGRPDHGDLPTLSSQFLAYDQNYTGGVTLSTGWVAGVEGGAKSIITGQTAGSGTVEVWSSGSRLDGSPAMYLMSPNHHDGHAEFRRIASFAPFADLPGVVPGVTVATTSTTNGADLLVGGIGSSGAEVREYGLGRPAPDANTVAPTLVTTLPPIPGVAGSAPLAGR